MFRWFRKDKELENLVLIQQRRIIDLESRINVMEKDYDKKFETLRIRLSTPDNGNVMNINKPSDWLAQRRKLEQDHAPEVSPL